MNPKKNPDEKIQKVNVQHVDDSVTDAHVNAIRGSAWKERVWLAAIGAVLTIVTVGQTLFMAWLQANTQAAIDRTNTAVAKSNIEVKQIKETGLATHELVNSGALADAERHLVTSKRLADFTKDPKDAEIAKMAEEDVAERRLMQAKAAAEKKKAKADDRIDAWELRRIEINKGSWYRWPSTKKKLAEPIANTAPRR